MNNFHNTVNKRDVKNLASYVLRKSLKLVAQTARTSAEVLIEILIVTAMRNSSIECACLGYKNAPSGKTVRTHIAQQLKELEDVEVRLNRGLRAHIPNQFRRKHITVAIDYVEVCYHGEADNPDYIRRSRPKEGTSHFHTYATAYAVHKGCRYTLAITYVKASDSTLDVLRRLNKRLNELSIHVKLHLLDRGYYSVEVIRWLKKYKKAFIMPMIARGKKSSSEQEATGSQALKESQASYWTSYTMKSPVHGQESFEAAICCTNYNGKHHRHGRQAFIYATNGVRHCSLQWIREVYRTRFGIETSHRQMREVRIKTTTTNSLARYLYIGIAFIIRNLWVWLHWHVFSTVQRGRLGRKLRLKLFSLAQMKIWVTEAIADIYVSVEQISVDHPLPAQILRFR